MRVCRSWPLSPWPCRGAACTAPSAHATDIHIHIPSHPGPVWSGPASRHPRGGSCLCFSLFHWPLFPVHVRLCERGVMPPPRVPLSSPRRAGAPLGRPCCRAAPPAGSFPRRPSGGATSALLDEDDGGDRAAARGTLVSGPSVTVRGKWGRTRRVAMNERVLVLRA